MTAIKRVSRFGGRSFPLLFLLLAGCATPTIRDTILRDMALGAVAGTLLGQTQSDNRAAYSMMYAGVGGLAAGAMSTYYHLQNEEKKNKENQDLKEELQRFKKQLEPQLIQQGHSLFKIPIPREVSKLVEPGEWKRYKMDQWVQDPNQPNTWYRQVEMFEIIPPVSR